jgi:hypothetical protein
MIVFEFFFVFNRMIFNLNNLDRDVTDFLVAYSFFYEITF